MILLNALSETFVNFFTYLYYTPFFELCTPNLKVRFYCVYFVQINWYLHRHFRETSL